MRRLIKQISLFLLIAVLLTTSCFAESMHQQIDNPNLSLDVTVGYDGLMTYGKTMPVQIRIENHGADLEGIIAVKASPIPGGVQFRVADNGRGMEEKELARITEAFYRVDKSRSRQQGGAGLGLALCKQIVELHNGTLHYDSKPGAGTQVTVTLYGKEAAQ